MAMSIKLPDEMIEEIVSWMSVKSVGQLHCVSKQWCSFLSYPKFIKAYLNYQSNKHEKFKHILISDVSQSLHSSHINPNPQNGIDTISIELSFQGKWKKIVGSCNGLVLVLNKEDVAFLINPTTLEYRRIPNSPLALPKRGTSTAGVLEGDLLCTFVDVYSARMGFWRILESISHNGAIPIHGFGVFLNGVLHLLVGKYYCSPSVIVSVNLTDEKFFEVPIPTITTTSLLRFYGIVALKGCLCVLGDRRNENEIDVWMMKEYGVVESWTKFSVVRNTFPFCPTPVCLMSDDDIILSAPGKAKLIIYNKKKEQQREMNVDGKTSKCIRIRTFMESLVSLMIGRETKGSDYIA
uniref:F-box family protein n=1 Tax=Solanum tuberosum TaxID=4113 RepID=M1DWG4_SOLTU